MQTRFVGLAGLLHANLLQDGQRQPVFVAIDATDDEGKSIIFYAQVLLCFVGAYLNTPHPLIYVRYMHTVQAVAREQRRALLPSELRGPFEAFRWALYPSGGRGHPRRPGTV